MYLPEHKCGLTIEHNQCRNYYQTVAQYIAEMKSVEMFHTLFESEEVLQKCIELNELWTMHWYPNSPISFYELGHYSLEGLLEYAKRFEEGL